MNILLTDESITLRIESIGISIITPETNLQGDKKNHKTLCKIPKIKNRSITARYPPAKYKYVKGPIAVEEFIFKPITSKVYQDPKSPNGLLPQIKRGTTA